MTLLSDHFSSHLQELRQRLIISAIALMVCTGIAYFFAKPISEFFMIPLFKAYPDLATLVYTNLTEAFFSYLKLAILIGIITCFPILTYQTWMYIAPALHKNEKKTVLAVVFFSSALFIGGVAFAYLVVLPEILTFLMGFTRDNLTPMPKFGAYLTFVARTSLTFGLAFEIPFLMVATSKTGLVKAEYFYKKRLYFYLVILILSFLLTAGDPFSAILLTMPLCLLYEMGIFITKLFC